MGGLVVKKAYILGQSDPQYKGIIQSVRSIVFLSTPHRGTNLADLLNKILSVSVFNHSSKQYVSELKQNSPALQDINEQFRNVAPKLQLFSLYETLPTLIGPRKVTVLERDSSVLGYPNEVSKGLDADHHNVCKYTDPEDPNYISVRNILRSLLGRFGVPDVHSKDHDNVHNNQRLLEFLGASAPPDDDYEFFRSRWMPGSCEWIGANREFNLWIEDHSLLPRVLWLHGVPGAGKSVLASYIIRHLGDLGALRQFFFFKHGEHSKRSVGALLRSLAFQIASEVSEYRMLLSNLITDVETMGKAEAQTLWQKIFKAGLFTLRLDRTLYWVIDGLDECDTPQQVISLLADIVASQTSIRILLISRRTQTLSIQIQRMAESVKVATLSVNKAASDLQQYVTAEMEYVPGRPAFKARVSQKILERADGNFLWVHLVLKNVAQCHTEAAIEETLDELPAELEPLYRRMESTLVVNSHPRDRGLTKIILTWAACSRRPLTVDELSHALVPEYSNVLNLEHTVIQVCGGFVTIDKKGHITMVHQTAREYLTKTPGLEYSVIPRIAHRELFQKCLAALSSSSQRLRSDQLSSQPFVLYASNSWFYHLALSAVSLDHLQTIMLASFFQGPTVLTWIHMLALTGQLRCLIQSSQSMSSYLAKQARIVAENSPLTQRLHEKECLESWATDLIKVLGKFRVKILRHPRSIYKLIPAFCPHRSMMYRQFGPKRLPGSLEVTGITDTDWDDCLAKIHIDRDTQPLKVECGDGFFAILTSSGTLTLYHTATCEEVRRFRHNERVLCFAFDLAWHKLVTYGFLTTKIWDVRCGDQLYAFKNPRNAKALAISFLSHEDVIVSCSDDRGIRRAILGACDGGWTMVEANPGGDHFNGKNYNSPRRVAYSVDGRQVAIAYRGLPLVVWAIDPPGVVGFCERLTDRTKRSQDLWTDMGPICWNPVTGHVLGLYADGCIFKWHPVDSDSQELQTVAADIQCSPNGNVFVTSSVDGTLRIWNFHHFALIYSLSCHVPVTDLAISPSGCRVYDLRDSFCHIWEPNALIRLAETDDEASDTPSTLGGFPQASEASSEMLPLVTALAVNPQSSIYCVGDDAGYTRVHKQGEKHATELSRAFLPVEHAVWSKDGTVLATADLGGRVSVWWTEVSTAFEGLQLILEVNIGRSVHQLLLSPCSGYLLVVTEETYELWSLSAKSMVESRSSLTKSSRWTHHPLEDALVLQFEVTKLTIYEWEHLAPTACVDIAQTKFDLDIRGLSIPDEDSPMNQENGDSISKVLSTSDGSQILLQTSKISAGHWRETRVILVSSSHLPMSPSMVETRPIKPGALPPAVGDRIESLVGLVAPSARRGSLAGTESGDVLVFLDKESWICSWSLDKSSTEATVKRHFFLPQDWLNSDYFRMSAISGDGTLFTPKNGDVAVIYNGLREAWFD